MGRNVVGIGPSPSAHVTLYIVSLLLRRRLLVILEKGELSCEMFVSRYACGRVAFGEYWGWTLRLVEEAVAFHDERLLAEVCRCLSRIAMSPYAEVDAAWWLGHGVMCVWLRTGPTSARRERPHDEGAVERRNGKRPRLESRRCPTREMSADRGTLAASVSQRAARIRWCPAPTPRRAAAMVTPTPTFSGTSPPSPSNAETGPC